MEIFISEALFLNIFSVTMLVCILKASALTAMDCFSIFTFMFLNTFSVSVSHGYIIDLCFIHGM